MNILNNEYESQNIKLDATHSQLKMRLVEIRMDKNWTIEQVRDQLERRFGSAPDDQDLQL